MHQNFIFYAIALLFAISSKVVSQNVSLRLDEVDITLIRRLASINNDNFLISPLGLKMGFSVLSETATGLTQFEISSVFGLNLDRNKLRSRYNSFVQFLKMDTQKYKPNFGNRVYLNKVSPRVKFGQLADSYYKTGLTYYDNEVENATNEIRSWASMTAERELDDIIKSEDLSASNVILLTVLYFKGPWQNKFFLIPETEKSGSLIQTTGNFFYSDWNKYDAQIVRIPYRDNFAMFIVVPNTKPDTARIVEGLNELSAQIRDMESKRVDVTLPEFKLESTLALDDYLKELGLTVVYNETVSSLSGIDRASKARLNLSKVVQKCGLVVHDSGFHSGFGGIVGSGTLTVRIVADKAFLFFIQHTVSGELLLAGRVNNIG